MNQFGQEIKQLREQKGFLQKDVANRLGIDATVLSKIEKGERAAKKEQIYPLSKILDVKGNQLLTLWLSDRVLEVVENEDVAHRVLITVSKKINEKK